MFMTLWVCVTRYKTSRNPLVALFYKDGLGYFIMIARTSTHAQSLVSTVHLTDRLLHYSSHLCRQHSLPLCSSCESASRSYRRFTAQPRFSHSGLMFTSSPCTFRSPTNFLKPVLINRLCLKVLKLCSTASSQPEWSSTFAK